MAVPEFADAWVYGGVQEGEIRLEESELADAQWFSVGNFPSLPPKMTIARKLIDWFVGSS